MEQRQERAPPPAYASHEPATLDLPSVPTHGPESHVAVAAAADRLPGIRALHLPDSTFVQAHSRNASLELSPRTTLEQSQWGTLPPLQSAAFPRVPDGLPRTSNDLDMGSPMDTTSITSTQDDRSPRTELRAVSVDDPDVRLAAEALSGLGNPDFARSPQRAPLAGHGPSAGASEPEPLLSLITSSHPWLGGTINGSMTAYTATKNYSPRFVKYGAELIERNIGSPMVNTVSSVGRRVGVEQNLRRYLGEMGRRPSDLEQGEPEGGRKRQRVMSPGSHAMTTDEGIPSQRTRGESQSSYAESLPAYDEHRSPQYKETADDDTVAAAQQDRRVNWSTQLMMTTSGLGVAMSDNSLRSLKHCLGMLKSATSHIDAVMKALSQVLGQYEEAMKSRHQTDKEAGPRSEKDGVLTNGDTTQEEARVREIADRMARYSKDIWNTLQQVVTWVSKTTGGALPQNAREVVRTQLLSVPLRWERVSRQSAAEDEPSRGEEARGARRMLAFAREGVDMMCQITCVVDGTVQSAETWLARVGRRAREQEKDDTVANDQNQAVAGARPDKTG